MIYFKSMQVYGNERQLLENALRKAAIKRVRSLDFQSAVYDMGMDKLFLGLDDTRDVKFTRLRTSLEKFFPKIIISFSRDKTSSEYRFRLSLLSTCVFTILLMVLLLSIVLAAIDHENYEAIVEMLLPMGLFILLTFFELKIVNSRIRKAVARYEKESGVN